MICVTHAIVFELSVAYCYGSARLSRCVFVAFHMRQVYFLFKGGMVLKALWWMLIRDGLRKAA